MENIGNYIIYEEISSGGAAVIYRAKNKTTGREVALKIIHQHLSRQADYRRRIQREINFIKGINHPNLMKVYGTSEINGQICIEMEYFKSVTLREWINKRKKLKPVDFYPIAVHIAEGLGALHRKNILHRDLSFGNILINEKNQVKITDFGLIKILPEHSQYSKITQLTAAGSTFGTLYFMSPEQLGGEEIGKESDIFAYGVNLYFMLTGKLPFAGKTGAAVINAIANYEPEGIIPSNSYVSFELQSLILNLLSKKPANRLKNIKEISKMLSLLAKKEHIVMTMPHRVSTLVLAVIVSLFLICSFLILFLTFFRKEVHEEKGQPAWNKNFPPSNVQKTVETSASLDEYTRFNFRTFIINLIIENFDSEEEKEIRSVFLRLVTLAKDKEIFFGGMPDKYKSENICNIDFKIEKNGVKIIFIEEWKAIMVKAPYRRTVTIDYMDDASLKTLINDLVLGSSLISNSVLFPEPE